MENSTVKVMMMRMLISVSILSFAILRASASFPNETLHYVVTYKWGVIKKDAGEATVSLTNINNRYNILLTAKSKPWADKIYSVRDTLRATISKSPFRPLRYEKAAREAGKYKKDVLTYSYAGSKVTATVSRLKEKNGKISKSTRSFTASGSAYDFMSIFYYLRSLDYSSMKAGTMIKKTVFSGSKSEIITIKCHGSKEVTLRDNRKYDAWYVSFRFTTEGGKKSSDDIFVWISKTPSHIPLLLEGSLPIGKVRCIYTGKI